MNTIISTLIGTLCLSVIVGADTGHPLALRLQGAVAVLVGIGNALMLLQAVALVFSEDMRTQEHSRWHAKTWLQTICRWLWTLAWLTALAWAGWLWSFGIRLVWTLVMAALVRQPQDQRQEGGAA